MIYIVIVYTCVMCMSANVGHKIHMYNIHVQECVVSGAHESP